MLTLKVFCVCIFYIACFCDIGNQLLSAEIFLREEAEGDCMGEGRGGRVRAAPI